MKKTIQKLTSTIALLVALLNYVPVFAKKQPPTQGAFDMDDNLWSIKLKTFSKAHLFRGIAHRSVEGKEVGITLFIGWKPFDGITIQSGLMYSHSDLATAGVSLFGTHTRTVNDWSGKSQIQEYDSKKLYQNVSVDCVNFHAISIPLYIRWYPGTDQQFALYAGPRWVVVLSKAEQTFSGILSSDERHFATDFLDFKSDDSRKQLGKHLVGSSCFNKVQIPSHFTLDFGFDYRFKSGFMIGMNGIGFELGYDFTKLLIRN